jgi:translation initiation factor 1 (eIF-1/SUI1)
MDRKEAIKVLNRLLDRIPELRQLEYGNKNYNLWHYEVCDTLENLFGRDSVEYKRFTVKIHSWSYTASETEKQKRYLEKLDEHETDLKSIIKRLEGKEALDSTLKAVSTTPKAFVAESGGKRPFEEAWEIEIQGDDIKKLYPIIASVAAELRFKDCFFEARLASSKETDSYAPFDVFTIKPTTSKTPIGFFALHSLGNNRIVLRVPPRSRWHHDGGLTPMELIVMGLSKSEYDEHFGQFIKSLEDRFAHYGLKVTPLKRLWQWLKSHKIFSIIITAIMFVAAVITIWGFASGAFS